MNEENVTDKQVSIPTSEGERMVNPELLRGYKDEAFNYLRAEAEAKESFKEVVETMAESTLIPKKDVRKWLKARYAEKVAEQKQIAETMEALDAALEEGLDE